MKINKDSIVLKIIFYTNIAIISSSVVVAFIITFITFQDMEARLLNTAKEKVFILEKAHMNYMFNMRGDITQILLKKKNLYEDSVEIDYEVLSKILKSDLMKNDFRKYYQVEIGLFDKAGRILGCSGKNGLFDKRSFLPNDRIKEIVRDKKYYTVKFENELYSRIILPHSIFKNEENNGYIILSNTDYLYGDFKKKPKE